MFTTHVHNFQKSEPNPVVITGFLQEEKENTSTGEKISLLQLINKNFNLLKFFNSLELDDNKFDLFTVDFVADLVKLLWDKWWSSTNSKDSKDSKEYDIKGISNLYGIELPSNLQMVIQGAKSLGAVFFNVIMSAVDIPFRTQPEQFKNKSGEDFELQNTFLEYLLGHQLLGNAAGFAETIKTKKTKNWINRFELLKIINGLKKLVDELTDETTEPVEPVEPVEKTKLYYKYYNFVVIVLEEYPKVLKRWESFSLYKTKETNDKVTNPYETKNKVTNTVAGVVANTVAGMVAVLLTTILPKIDNKLLKKLNELKEILKDPEVNFIQLVMSLLQIALQVFHNVSANNDGKGIFEIWNKWVVEYYGPYYNALLKKYVHDISHLMCNTHDAGSIKAIRDIVFNYKMFLIEYKDADKRGGGGETNGGGGETKGETKGETNGGGGETNGGGGETKGETKDQETFLDFISGKRPSEIFSKSDNYLFHDMDEVIFTPFVDLICLNENDAKPDKRYLLSGNDRIPMQFRSAERENFTINHHVHMLLLSSLDFPNKPQIDRWGICDFEKITINTTTRKTQREFFLKMFKRITNVLDIILKIPTVNTFNTYAIGPGNPKPCPVGCKNDDTVLTPYSSQDYYKFAKDIVFSIINSYDELGGMVSLLREIPIKPLLGKKSLSEYLSTLTLKMDGETLSKIWGFIGTKLFTEEIPVKLGLFSTRRPTTRQYQCTFYDVLLDREIAEKLWNNKVPETENSNVTETENSSENNFTDQTWYQMCESIIKQIHYGLAFIETKMRSTLFIDITTLKIQQAINNDDFTYRFGDLITAPVTVPNFGALVILEPQDYSSCKIYVSDSKNVDKGYGLEVRPRLSATDYILPTLSAEAVPFLSAGGEKESVLYGSMFSQEWAENIIIPILFPQHPNTINMKQHIMSVLDRYQPGYDLIRITRQLLACGPYRVQNGTFHTEPYYNTDIAIRPKTWPILQSFTSANRTATEIYSGKNYVEKSSNIQGVFTIVNNIYFDPDTYIDEFKNRIATTFSNNNVSAADAVAKENAVAKEKQEKYKDDESHWIRHTLARYGTLPRRVVYINPLHELVKSLKNKEAVGYRLRSKLSTALTAKTKFKRKMYPLDIANFDKNVLAKISNRIKIGAVESSVLEFDELPNISDELIEKISNTNEYLITKGKAGGVYRIMDLVTNEKKKDETKAQYALKLPLSKTRNTNTEEDYSVFRSTESINETLISIAASSLYVRGISPNFIEVKAAYTNKNSGVSLVMEVIQGDLLNHKRVYDKLIDSYVDAGYLPENIPTYESITTNVIAQVIFSIVTFQTKLGAVHNDLHLGNIFLKLCDDTKYKKKKLCEMTEFVYDIGNKTYKVPNIGILAKIGDFGLTTMGIKRGGADMDNESSHMYDNDKVRIVRMVEFKNRNRVLYDALVGTDEGKKVQRIIGEFIKGLGVLGNYNAVSQFADGIQRRTSDMFNENIDIAYLMAALRMHPSFQNHPLVFEHREIQRKALRHLFIDKVVSKLIFSEDVLSASVVLAIVQWNNSDIADRITGAVSSTILGDSTSARISPTLLILRSKLLQTLLHKKDENNGGNVIDEGLSNAVTVEQHEKHLLEKVDEMLEDGMLQFISEKTQESADEAKDREAKRIAAEEAAKRIAAEKAAIKNQFTEVKRKKWKNPRKLAADAADKKLAADAADKKKRAAEKKKRQKKRAAEKKRAAASAASAAKKKSVGNNKKSDNKKYNSNAEEKRKEGF
jgi:hypothetical protein